MISDEDKDSGVGDGNRTRNVRSHSPVLCQLSYSHRVLAIITTRAECRERTGRAAAFVLRARSLGTGNFRRITVWEIDMEIRD